MIAMKITCADRSDYERWNICSDIFHVPNLLLGVFP